MLFGQEVKFQGERGPVAGLARKSFGERGLVSQPPELEDRRCGQMVQLLILPEAKHGLVFR